MIQWTIAASEYYQLAEKIMDQVKVFAKEYEQDPSANKALLEDLQKAQFSRIDFSEYNVYLGVSFRYGLGTIRFPLESINGPLDKFIASCEEW